MGAAKPVLKHGPNTACGGNARKRASRCTERLEWFGNAAV